jgi:hypothetical protein
MTTYTVHMVNFNVNKGTFKTLQAAIDQARALGFECAIYVNEPGKPSQYLQTVRPY